MAHFQVQALGTIWLRSHTWVRASPMRVQGILADYRYNTALCPLSMET